MPGGDREGRRERKIAERNEAQRADRISDALYLRAPCIRCFAFCRKGYGDQGQEVAREAHQSHALMTAAVEQGAVQFQQGYAAWMLFICFVALNPRPYTLVSVLFLSFLLQRPKQGQGLRGRSPRGL